MVAVYYYEEANPFRMYVLDVENADHEKFLKLLVEKEEYPFPTADVVFIEGDKVIDQWSPSQGIQKSSDE